MIPPPWLNPSFLHTPDNPPPLLYLYTYMLYNFVQSLILTINLESGSDFNH